MVTSSSRRSPAPTCSGPPYSICGSTIMFASRCIRRTFPRRRIGRGSGMEDSLYFSEQHLAVRNMVREFARGEVAPVAAELDAKAEFPWANVKKMGELGLLGIPWPEELGGAGLDLIIYIHGVYRVAKVNPAPAINIS